MTKPTSVEQPTLISMVLRFVQNFLPDFSAAEIIWVRSMKASKFAVFNVQCRSVVSATRVKSTFASIVKSTNKPAYIKDISISFAHTVGTRVRISLMRAMSKRQKEKDPNAVCSVSAFTSRPLLRVGGKDQGTRFLSFVDAIAGFRHLLTQDDLDKALSLCSGQKGRLKSKYLVLSDDRILPPYQGRKQPRGAPGQVPTSQPPGGQQQAPQAPPPVPSSTSVMHPVAQVYTKPPPLPMFGSMSVQHGQPFIQHYLQGTVPGLTMIPSLQPGSYAQATASQLPHQAQLQVALPQPGQVLVSADVHAPPVGAPFTKVARKRVHKPAAPTTSKCSTPMRKSKAQKDSSSQSGTPGQTAVADKPDQMNSSRNDENFASCDESDVTDITEAVEVVGET